MMTTRRAFLAAAFGAATARAVPKYFPLVLRSKPMSKWIGEFRIDSIVLGCSVLIDPRQSQTRLDFLRGDATYWLNKPLEWLPPDGTRS